MTDEEIYSLEKRCSRGEIILINPKDWRIYDIFLEDDNNSVTVHRCIDSETHEDEPAWSGSCEQIKYRGWNEISFNKELILLVYKEQRIEPKRFSVECDDGNCTIQFKKPYLVDETEESQYIPVMEIGYKRTQSGDDYYFTKDKAIAAAEKICADLEREYKESEEA